MTLKPLEEIVAAYPWPALGYPDRFRQVLRFILADQSITDPRCMAYVLATIRHETAFTFAPIEEYGIGEGRAYGEIDPETGQSYFGRGYVQLTWKENYRRFSPIVGYDLVTHPSLALEPAIAYKIVSAGMGHGLFTGKKLQDFVTIGGKYNYLAAREIINGKDQAEKIADYAEKFYASFLPA